MKDCNIGYGKEIMSDKKLKKDMSSLSSKCMPNSKQ